MQYLKVILYLIKCLGVLFFTMVLIPITIICCMLMIERYITTNTIIAILIVIIFNIFIYLLLYVGDLSSENIFYKVLKNKFIQAIISILMLITTTIAIGMTMDSNSDNLKEIQKNNSSTDYLATEYYDGFEKHHIVLKPFTNDFDTKSKDIEFQNIMNLSFLLINLSLGTLLIVHTFFATIIENHKKT
ncbi:hypothetical protein FOC55_02755 [Staphylococcus hominis]|uniref:hypothetical protein n=2 Tax=Staphylococcus hominis TaxID=1290 RepID=UPI0012DD3586|nr:hypothetical protein [Staphylococcus hominis]QGR76859.1 hypothetical protein FOC55_02755 [Staphylococcus hominis]